MRTRLVLLVLLAVTVAVSPLAADSVIQPGIDVFTTTANARTFYDFADEPIPAGFFCEGSPAFSGRVALRGLPLETALPGALRGTDTVLERLDEAVLDAAGVATTRVRFRALSLVSIEPIATPCGSFHVYVSLAGEQRPTTMRIYRTQKQGGVFIAPLAVDARMTFVPVAGSADGKLELTGSVTFPARPLPWSFADGTAAKRIGAVVVDTDGDLEPDTELPGTSNFAPGWSPDGSGQQAPGNCTLCEPAICHDDGGEEHCTGPVYACYPANCP